MMSNIPLARLEDEDFEGFSGVRAPRLGDFGHTRRAMERDIVSLALQM